jgi:hypothetical protein
MQNELLAKSPIVSIALRPRRILLFVFTCCVLVEATIFLLDWHINYGEAIDYGPIQRLTNVTREDSIASWFSVTQTAFVALTVWLVCAIAWLRGDSRWTVAGWTVLGLFFTYMSFDDGSAFHERLGTAFRMREQRHIEWGLREASDASIQMFPSYSWQAVFLPIFATLGLFVVGFLWWQLKACRPRLVVLTAVGCLVVAVGLDFFEGLDEYHELNVLRVIGEMPAVDSYMEERFETRGYTAVVHFQKSVEEVLEMFGMTLFWLVFLHQFMQMASEYRLRIVPPD